MLWTCLLLPSLPLDVFARGQTPADAAKPFAVTTGGHYPRVVIANAAAAAAGVCTGQLVSASLALAPDLILRDRDPQAEAAALAAVAAWTTQFTPAVSLAPPNAVLAEIGGSLRLFGGLPQIADQFANGARDLGYAARLAFAPTPTAALLFARTDKSRVRYDFSCSALGFASISRKVVSDPTFQSALAPLPLSQLDVEPEVIEFLAAAGITTFGQACALPRDALARRVGAAFVATLDRARGLAADPRPPFVPPPRYEGKLELPATIENVEALAFAVNRLVHELAGWLLGRGLGIVGMSLSLVHERYVGVRMGIPATVVHFGFAAPARDPVHLVAVLRERLARVTLPAPVIALVLASEETASLAGRNLGLLPGDEAHPVVPLLDRLRARLGEDAVIRVMPHPEHRPERAWESRVKYDFSRVGESRPRYDFSRKGSKSEGAARKVVSDPTFPDPRPVWLLAEPEPIGHALETRPWVLRDGPERIESGWWDGADVRRDYFVAQSPRGETVWLYRDHRYGTDDGEWFVHGLFA
jgi:protein ImuB